MGKTLEEQIVELLRSPREQKARYTFTLSPSVKRGLKKWCKEKDVAESPAIEAMIRQVIPERYFEKKKS